MVAAWHSAFQIMASHTVWPAHVEKPGRLNLLAEGFLCCLASVADG
jgi:hypothetical protein